MRLKNLCLFWILVFAFILVPCCTKPQDSNIWDATKEPSQREIRALIEMLEKRLNIVESKQLQPKGSSNGTQLTGQCKKDFRAMNVPIYDKRKCSIISQIGNLSMDPAVQKKIFILESAKLKLEEHNNEMMMELQSIKESLNTLKNSSYIRNARMELPFKNTNESCNLNAVTTFFSNYDEKVLRDFNEKITEMSEKATKYKNNGDYISAMKIYQDVITLRYVFHSEENIYTMNIMSWAAWTLNQLNRSSEAVFMYKNVLEKQRIILGNNHKATVRNIKNIIAILFKKGNYSSGMKYIDELIQLKTENYIDDLKFIFGSATTLRKSGLYEEYLNILSVVLEKRIEILGEDHVDTFSTLNWIAWTLQAVKNKTESIVMYEKLLKHQRKVLGDSNKDTIGTISNLGTVLYNQKRYTEALKYFNEALEKRIKISGLENAVTLNIMEMKAYTLKKLGQKNEALDLLKILLEKRSNVLGENHSDTKKTKDSISQLG